MIRLVRSRPAPILATAAVLALGLASLPVGSLQSWRDTARSLELNQSEREAGGGGYYQGLINGGGGGAPDELTMRLLGEPDQWMSFHDLNATRYMKEDFLLFELRPNTVATVFGRPFSTNRFGLRDRRYAREKADGTIRIALLGSSIDMGWGVGDDQTYENRLEDWLNAHAARRGIDRRFEVLNFAVAAYSPWQRVEAFRRKVMAFQPDLVLYSATLLDPRLQDLHLCKVLEARIDIEDEPIRRAIAAAGITRADLRLNADDELADRAALKRKLRPKVWGLMDDALGTLAADCRLRGVPLSCLVIPRAGQSDTPDERAASVARTLAIAAHHAVPALDLSDAFDGLDPASVSIAPWDDHPNARGHKFLFVTLARAVVGDAALYRTLFGVDPPDPREVELLSQQSGKGRPAR